MIEINIFQKTGKFAGNKDIARDVRINEILPSLDKGERVTLNFKEVDSATQSFIHALISDVIRQEKIDVLDRVDFKNCNETIRKIIEIVIEYMQESNY